MARAPAAKPLKCNYLMMFDRKRYYIIIIVVSTLLITYLHYWTTPQNHILHNIQTELHYIPLLLGAIVFGLRGAVLTFIFITLLYLPYFITSWTDPFLSVINRLLHILLSGLISSLAGFLVDRERRQRRESEKDRYLADIGRVATTIVHDLKNPLITIMGFARRIQEGKGNIDQAVQAIIESARNMQRMVLDVLDFSKPIRLTLGEEDIGDIVNRACDSCRTRAEGEKVALSVDLPAEPVKLLIDGFHLERAIVNLINNAIDASREGGEVTISAVSDRDHMVIRIKDHGAGMDSETLKKIFVPFYTTKRVGTGLGMSIVKKIIEGHQGRIRIDSQPGAGTEAIIQLPYELTGEKSIFENAV